MNRKTLFALGLGLTLTLGLDSCKDNDLIDGDANGGGEDTELTDAKAQKYQALQNLLGALADVDSLPSNWDSKDYTVAPTVGVLKDDAQPHIRYVSTTSQAEADRIYRSYLSKDVSATPSDDSWQMDGIGTMQFHLENEPNHYATLKINVQQLPTLEEIRFVNEAYMGNNGWIAPKGCYYSFGDVVLQDVVGADDPNKNPTHTPTLWVCVRPCSTNPNRRQSHWCSLQLVPAGSGNMSNYLEVGTNGQKSYLPTKLAFNKSDAERMVQNFFNVLRIMAAPDVARSGSYAGIDDILASTNSQASYLTLRTTSFMWDYLNIWTKDFNLTDGSTVRLYKKDNLDNDKDLFTLMRNTSNDEISINAYYNGYTKNLFAKGDYTVYNLYLTTKGQAPFLDVKKQTGYVLLNEAFDFRQLENGLRPKSNFEVNSDADNKNSAYQFIVKYRTGAELEGYSHSTIDVDPSMSFEKRTNNNRITDLLVSGLWLKKKAYTRYNDKNGKVQTLLPFFSIGDIVTSRLVNGKEPENYFNFCVRNAYDKFGNNDESLKNNALFMGYGGTENMRVQPTEKDIAAGLYRMLKAALIFSNEAEQYFSEESDYRNQYENKEEVETNDPQSRLSYLKSLYMLYLVTTYRKMFAHFEANYDDKKRVARLTAKIGSDYYTLELTRTGQGKDLQDSYRLIKEKNCDKVISGSLNFYTYNDQFGMHEDYSYTRTLVAKSKDDRDFLKTALADDLKNFYDNLQQ